jgi:hypothetical protein
MGDRNTYLKNAAGCREKAKSDPAHADYRTNEAIVWLQRARKSKKMQIACPRKRSRRLSVRTRGGFVKQPSRPYALKPGDQSAGSFVWPAPRSARCIAHHVFWGRRPGGRTVCRSTQSAECLVLGANGCGLPSAKRGSDGRQSIRFRGSRSCFEPAIGARWPQAE